MRHDVLLLNANAAPVSWLPLSAICWQDAISLLWLDRVDILHSYENWTVRSPSTIIEVPAVMMLRKQVRGFHRWVARENSPQPHLVYLRDLYLCQYCNKRFPRKLLTIDHVLPRSHGGKTTYSNVTTACGPCNTRRGNDVRIRPSNAPYRPTMNQLIKNMRQFPMTIPHPAWNLYLQWDASLIVLTNAHNSTLDNDNFDIGINLEVDSALTR